MQLVLLQEHDRFIKDDREIGSVLETFMLGLRVRRATLRMVCQRRIFGTSWAITWSLALLKC